MDKIEDYLEVGRNDAGEIVVSHSDLKQSADGIALSSSQARSLARLLLQHAEESERDTRHKAQEAQYKAAEAIPVDRSKRTLTDGSEVTEDHREIISGGVRDGQQKAYIVLSDSERAKGFVRPFRDSYEHTVCGTVTTMGRSIAETYARDPKFYSGTFCADCKKHFPLAEFVWNGTTELVGS